MNEPYENDKTVYFFLFFFNYPSCVAKRTQFITNVIADKNQRSINDYYIFTFRINRFSLTYFQTLVFVNCAVNCMQYRNRQNLSKGRYVLFYFLPEKFSDWWIFCKSYIHSFIAKH